MTQSWRPATNTNPFYKPSGLTLFFLIFLGLFVVSCKENESEIGLNLRPDKGEIYSAETDTFTVNAFTVREDSILTDSLSTNILGAMNDPLFGLSSSTLASELTIIQADINFGPAPKVDSALIYIRWDKAYYYGNLNSAQSMSVYYVNDKIDPQLKYYSNHKAALGNEIGTWQGIFNFNDSVSFKKDNKIQKRAPGLIIKLYKKAGEDFAFANPAIYNTVEDFKSFIKGIAIIPNMGGLASGEGAIVGVDFFTGASELVVYYNDSSNHSFKFNNSCANFNVYNHKHGNPDLLNQLNNYGIPQNTSYVQSMAGCKTKIEIPHLLNISNGLVNERIIINEAALILTPKNGTVSTQYGLPSRINLFQPHINTNQNHPILDFSDYISPNSNPVSLYGGSYNSLTGNYTIRFTRHLQDLIDYYLTTGTNLNRGFFVTIPSDKPITPTRLVLDNTRLGLNKALKIRITYSKIKI